MLDNGKIVSHNCLFAGLQVLLVGRNCPAKQRVVVRCWIWFSGRQLDVKLKLFFFFFFLALETFELRALYMSGMIFMWTYLVFLLNKKLSLS